MDMNVNMLFLTLLMCYNPYVFGLFEDINIEEDLSPDLTDFDLDIVSVISTLNYLIWQR